MILNITLVYSDIKDKERLEEADTPPFFVDYLDMMSKEGKSKGFKLKSEFGARLDPFAVMYKDGSAVKAYYSEDSKDIISDIVTDLNKEV